MTSGLSPRHSVVVTTDGTASDAFLATAASVHGQLAGNVELVECRPNAGGPVAALNDALRRAAGEFITFADAGDILHAHALAAVDHRFIENDETDFVYTDEDRMVGGVRLEPFYKPDWSPDRMRCQMYTGRMAVMRRSLIDEVGGFREALTGTHEFDLVLRVTEQARRVAHVPDVFFHRGSGAPIYGIEDTTRGREAGRRAIADHLERTGFPAAVEVNEEHGTYRLVPRLTDEPLVSIVIPTNGAQRRVYGRNIDLVVNCVRSIVERSTYKNYEIICVIDDDTPDFTRQALPEVAEGRIRFVRYAHKFNFSRKINLGTLHSAGEYFLLLNDDTEVITSDWIENLLMYAQQDGVGAAGATLLFADGRIQHAGIVILDGDPGHPYYAFPADWEGYFGNLRVPCNYLGVTAACSMSRREVFEEVGGLSLSFPLNYNDVDYGMKLQAAGYRVLCTPDARMYHFESSSRGVSEVEDEEKDLLHSRWRNALMRDPFYSPHFLRTADYLTLSGVGGATPAELRV